ncbi:TetR/AcrR family transcriptional regulator [Halalkalibacter sp. APA_J-10(15)]|uniref:TetR/AcrR family transcriptional regulator n=1 Tax=unclassified Halalkalibacter TaxID=2893063 RepID=UPI001FF3BE16|nr:TetR/AcrR family transcriptional regulator [Halalkalibacter sp. APA_J-10(15)]MCK0471693.1 TetR/AcrR family transcriptional regulator [Halalkalibacter sp. APA_J-10(15)]
MTRKYKSEETKGKIIAISTKLFIERGFEKTSIRDICEAIGMSKGAIYHHFKSKAEIIEAVKENKYSNVEQTVNDWINEIDAQSAKEKLTGLLEKDLKDQEAHSLDEALSTQIKSSDFIVSMMKDSVNKSAPIFAKIIEEGNRDGSITTDYPYECSEVFFLLLNVWCDPQIMECNEEQLHRRLTFLQLMMKRMGVDIMSDSMVQDTEKFLKNLYSGGGEA